MLLGPVPAGVDVLDVGCGTGIASRQMAERGAKVLGVELAPRMAEIARGHLDMDAVGHYSRPDIFELRIDTRRRSPVVFSDSSSTPNPTAGIADSDDR